MPKPSIATRTVPTTLGCSGSLPTRTIPAPVVCGGGGSGGAASWTTYGYVDFRTLTPGTYVGAGPHVVDGITFTRTFGTSNLILSAANGWEQGAPGNQGTWRFPIDNLPNKDASIVGLTLADFYEMAFVIECNDAQQTSVYGVVNDTNPNGDGISIGRGVATIQMTSFNGTPASTVGIVLNEGANGAFTRSGVFIRNYSGIQTWDNVLVDVDPLPINPESLANYGGSVACINASGTTGTTVARGPLFAGTTADKFQWFSDANCLFYIHTISVWVRNPV